MDAIRKLQKVSDDSKLNTIEEVLSKIDEDHDGSVRIDTVAKVSVLFPLLLSLKLVWTRNQVHAR